MPVALDTGQLARRAETLVLGGMICVLSQGFLPVGRFAGLAETQAVGTGDPWANALQVGVLACMLLLAVLRWTRLRTLLGPARGLAVVWLYCVVSAAWSDNPGTTLRRSLLLLTYLGFGFVAVACRGRDGSVRLMRDASVFMLAASVLLFAAVPSIGQDVDPYAGALRGVFVQKNVAAWAFELALCFVGYDVLRERRIRAATCLLVPCFLAALALTRSTTELLSSAALLVFWLWAGWFRRSARRVLPLAVLFAGLLLALTALAGLGDAAFTLIGKDPTFTGRGPIWQAARGLIADRPLLGYGFQGFWLPGDRVAEEIWAELEWQAPHAHNGVLELLVETGFVGLALYLGLFLRLLGAVARGIARRDSALAWWSLSWMLLTTIKGLTEPVYLTLDMATALLSFSLVALAAETRATAASPARGGAARSAASIAPRIRFGLSTSS